MPKILTFSPHDFTAGNTQKQQKAQNIWAFSVVEPRRVELLSENPSARLSTSVAVVLEFPRRGPQRQGRRFGSFINPACGKAYAGWFPTLMTPVSSGVGT